MEWINRARAKQIVDFTNLRRGTKYPTDIDGLLDMGGKGFVFFELKYNGKDVPFGQRLALERLAKAATSGGYPSVSIIADHYVERPEIDIDASCVRVREVYFGSQQIWRHPDRALTLGEAIDAISNQIKTY